MAGEGRPTDCTPELIQLAGELMAEGHPVRAMCRALRISPTSHYAWIERGERGEAPFSNYVNAVRAGMSTAERAALTGVRSAFRSDWRSCAWWLEHVMQEDYGRRQVEISGPDGGPVQVEDLTAKVRKVLRATPSGEMGIPDDVLGAETGKA